MYNLTSYEVPRNQASTQRAMAPEQISTIGEAVRLAPSIHNTQPWRLRALPDGLEIAEDVNRGLDVADPTGRERLISCGAAVFNAAVAMTNLGWKPRVELLPGTQGAAGGVVVGRVTRGRYESPTEQQRRLFAAIPERRTHRRVFLPLPLAPSTLVHLYGAAREHGAWLHLVGSASERGRLSALMARASRMLTEDPAYADEIRRWVNRGGTDSGHADGIPIASMGRGPYPVDGLAHRNADNGTPSRAEVVDEELARSTVVVLFTPGRTASDHVAAGMALQHVLLSATAHGLAASFANQALEIPELCEELAAALGEPGQPQMLLRIGRPMVSVPATPRRPLDSLFDN